MWLRSLRGAAVPLFLCLLQSVSGGYLITWQKLWFEGSPAQVCIALDEMPLPTDALTVQVLVSKSSRRYPNYPEFSYSGGTAYVPEEVIDQLDLNPENEEVVLEESLTPTPGTKYSCLSLLLPELPNSSNYGTVRVNGTIHGARIDETRSIRILYMRQSFLQTDKEKYKPGQKVQFRVLTLEVPNMKVSTEPYSSIYINDPKGTRIKQWLNVPNTAGLIHLEYQLFDEQKEGSYSIIATTSDSQVYKRFKVEKYVLPRFEVTLDAPGYALASDDTLEMEVCAQYTFGEPVKGNLAININNGRYGSSEREVNFVDELMGCKSVEIPLSSLRINYLDFVYRLRITVEVEEEGTGVVKRETASIPVKRTALRFERLESRKYPRLELPYFSSLRVTYNDGDPAKNEPMTVCTKRWVLPLEAQRMRQENGCYTATSSPTQNSSMTLCPEIVCQYLGTNNAGIPVAACLMVLCRNMTTDDSGVLRVTIPPHLFSDSLVVAVVEVTASNYPDLSLNGSLRNYMYKSSTQVYLGRKPYFSPSNSSLLINVDYRKLSCTSGSNIQLELPVLYTASDPEQVTLYVQVVSWGLIQTSMTSISLSGSAIEIDDSTLIEQMMPPSSPNIRRGAFTLPLTLPPSVSPGVRILIWYTRPDGEVVSDEQPLEVSKCLNYAVELSWPDDKVEFGTEQPLTVTAQPNALCSIGVVDKSVELLSAQTSLIDQIFFMPPITSNVMSDSSQIDDFAHCIRESCRANLRTADRSEEQPSLRMIGAETSYVYPSYSFTSKHVDAIRMFDDAGLFVISDHTLETRPCTKQDQGGGYPYNPYGYGYGNVGILGGLTSGLAVMGGGGTEGIVAGLQGPTATGGAPGLGDIDDSEPITPAVTVKTRAYFPETWLWELQTIPDSGIYTEDRILPDTITEWVGRAVCVHPDQGVGISASTSITTFTSFFIDLTLPPSIKVGEILPVKISVFNYFNTSLSVLVTLEESSDYEILGANGTEAMADQAAGGQRSACVPTQDKETVVVRIRLLTPGSVNITVSAEVIPGLVDDCESGNPINRRDRIIKSMPVDYEGFMREITSSIYHCSGEVLPAEWPITAPSAANIVNNSIVDNSERGFVTASGDLLGPTLANLGWLIRMPYGCGEQNLARFAPNIYIMHYLERSQQVNATVTEKIIRYMNQGYERQLKYRRTDGSYSSFGNRDKYGSTWLTAFVLKSYAQAKAYISVSTNEIQRTTRWLKGLQVSSGCFESVGHAHNRRMRGSDFAPATLSAYVMAALLEAGTSPTDSSITSAADCITNASSAGASGENDVYLLALKAYAFSLAGLPQTKDVIDDLFTRSDEDINGIYWKLNSYSGWYSGSLSVETTSYVLLAMLKSDYPDSQGRKVQLLKWIISRRNGQGGFISTQDTVVALQALALFGKPVSDKPLNMTIDVSGGGIMTRFQVEESNKLVHQRVDLSFIPDKLNTTASGDGCALLETVVRYNVKDPDLSEVFSLSVWSRSDYSSEICPSYIVNVCATYTPVNKESNMGIIEVNLVSGYRPDIDGLERIVNDVTGTIKRYDVDGSQVIFYIDQFSDSQICVNFPVFQEVEVEFTHPGTVKVYDYYEPDFYVTKRLTFSRRYCKPYWIL